MEPDDVYEERIVVFIDILGFRELINRTKTDQLLSEKILWILNYVKGIRDDNRAGTQPECDVVGRQVTIFSDSVVISYPTYSPSCLFYAILDIVYLQLTMFYNGFPVRGGISIGNIHHQQDVAFGPALIDAYDLETTQAIYPRVILTKSTVEVGLKKNPHNLPEHEKKHVFEILSKDTDELYYVDFLKQRAETDDDHEYHQLLHRVKSMILNGLSSDNVSIQEKYIWLKDKYNATVNKQNLTSILSLVEC